MNKDKLLISLLSTGAFLNLLAAVIIVAAAALPTMAYEEDTHFLMTYIICRSVGLTEKEALTVAEVDQGMDDSKELRAFYFHKTKFWHSKVLVPEQWLWHAIRRQDETDGVAVMTVADIVARRKDLFEQAVNDPDPKNRLIRLGIFFHYQQDSWAHRDHSEDNHLSEENYKPVDAPKGHAWWFSQPDRPPYDPVAALMCLEEGIVYAADFVTRGMGKEPTAFLRGYKPSGGIIDVKWKDDRQSEYFNQISLAGLEDPSARLFLTSLIREQINTYTADNANPRHVGKKTANAADLYRMRTSLGKICERFKASLGFTIMPPSPDKRDRKCFTNMKTMQLLSRGMAGVDTCNQLP